MPSLSLTHPLCPGHWVCTRPGAVAFFAHSKLKTMGGGALQRLPRKVIMVALGCSRPVHRLEKSLAGSRRSFAVRV